MIANFYSEHTVKGRRAYPCNFCRRGILAGALHVTVSSCDGGVMHAHRAHIECHEAATGQPAPARATKASTPAVAPSPVASS